jgi:SulP family sulfate permease
MLSFLPTPSDFQGFRKYWKNDLVAGITVGIVALPLALAFGVTTGTGAASGLITAIFAGFLAALFGGSNYQVSGPTGAMTVVLVPIVSKFGPGALFPLGIGAGVIVLLSGLLRFGGLINKVPWPVMEGFTLGIALVIALQQLPGALAIVATNGNGTLGTAINTFKNAVSTGLNLGAISIVLLTLFIKFSYPKIASKLGIKLHIPASFIAIIFSTLFAGVFKLGIPRVGELPKNIFLVNRMPHNINFQNLIIPCIEIALLAAIESLLSARIADGMAKHHEGFIHSKPNRELFGQGIASTVSSIFGGLPATGAIARTGVNVRSGARTRAASIIHALFLLSAVFILNPIIAQIPIATLAGILIGTSYRIARPSAIKEALATTKIDAATLLITATIVLLFDLIWGIIIGCLLYFLMNLFTKAAKNKLDL